MSMNNNVYTYQSNYNNENDNEYDYIPTKSLQTLKIEAFEKLKQINEKEMISLSLRKLNLKVLRNFI